MRRHVEAITRDAFISLPPAADTNTVSTNYGVWSKYPVICIWVQRCRNRIGSSGARDHLPLLFLGVRRCLMSLVYNYISPPPPWRRTCLPVAITPLCLPFIVLTNDIARTPRHSWDDIVVFLGKSHRAEAKLALDCPLDQASSWTKPGGVRL
jgi:hypothetical protein